MEIFRLLGMIAIDNTEANRAIDETARRASDSEKKTGGSFSKIGSAAVSAGKWIAGAEAITPIDTLLAFIREALKTENEPVIFYIQKLISLLAEYLPVIAEKDQQIVLDGNTLVARLAPRIDQELGILSNRKQRGNI